MNTKPSIPSSAPPDRLITSDTWPLGRDGQHHPPPLPKGELLPPLELPVPTLIDLQSERLP